VALALVSVLGGTIVSGSDQRGESKHDEFLKRQNAREHQLKEFCLCSGRTDDQPRNAVGCPLSLPGK
jgi:hypothetical protein